MVNILVAAAALAAASPTAAPPAPANANPAIFVVRDADTDRLYFRHIPRSRRPVRMVQRSGQGRLREVQRAGARNPDPRNARTDRVARSRCGCPASPPSASFLATTRMAINAGKTQGMQVGNGADMVLRHEAELEGKPVEGLETLRIAAGHVHADAGDRGGARAQSRRRRSSRARWRACRRRWGTCSRHGSAATRACS